MLFATVFLIYFQAKYTTPVTTSQGESVYDVLFLLILKSITMTAPKVIPPTVLCLPTMSEADSYWYDSKDLTFPSIFYYILLSCNKWHKRGKLTKCFVAVFCSWLLALSNRVIVLFVFVITTMEINKRNYLQSNLCNLLKNVGVLNSYKKSNTFIILVKRL